jgi:hypothetical protein
MLLAGQPYQRVIASINYHDLEEIVHILNRQHRIELVKRRQPA